MSKKGRNLNRHFRRLTPRERALAILNAMNNGSPAPSAATMVPPDQEREFDYYMSVIGYASGNAMVSYLLLVAGQVQQLGIYQGWIALVMLWQAELSRAETRTREKLPHACLEAELFSQVPEEPVRLAEELLDTVLGTFVEDLGSAWQKLRAAEVVVGEAARELGADPSHPATRELLNDLNGEIQGLQEFARKRGRPIELAESAEEEVARLRCFVSGGEPDTSIGALGERWGAG